MLTGDLIERLPDALDLLPAGCTPVVFHTAVLRLPRAGAPGGVRRAGALAAACAGSPRSPRASSPAIAARPRRAGVFVLSVDGRAARAHRAARRPDRLAVTPERGRRADRVGESVGVGPWAGPWPDDPRLRPGAARRRRPAQRRRPLPLLDASRRSSPTSTRAGTPSTSRSRTSAARLQHRHGRPHRQRVPRRRGAHRRPPPLEPARRDGHRPLPARAPPRRRRRPGWRSPRREGCRWSASTTCPAPCRSRPPTCRERLRAAVRPGGPGLTAGGPRRRAALTVSIAQFGSTRSINAGRRGRHRDARLDPPARRPRGGLGEAQAAQRRVGVDAALDQRLLHRPAHRADDVDAGPALVVARRRRARAPPGGRSGPACPRPRPRRRRASRGCASPRR